MSTVTEQADIYQNGEDIDDSMFDDPEDFVDSISDAGKQCLDQITCRNLIYRLAFCATRVF